MRKIIGKLTLATILIGTLGIGFLGLVVYNVKDMVFGTRLIVHTLANGATVTDPYIAITGTAKHAQQITINGRAIGVDQQGNFNDGIIASAGYNIVRVTETNQFGKTKVDTYQWVYAPSVSVAQNDVSPYQR